MKHAEAGHVNIQLFRIKDDLVLLIEDDGKGFIFDNKKKEGNGLMNIITRIKSVHGEINYEPGLERGTVATVRIPLG